MVAQKWMQLKSRSSAHCAIVAAVDNTRHLQLLLHNVKASMTLVSYLSRSSDRPSSWRTAYHRLAAVAYTDLCSVGVDVRCFDCAAALDAAQPGFERLYPWDSGCRQVK